MPVSGAAQAGAGCSKPLRCHVTIHPGFLPLRCAAGELGATASGWRALRRCAAAHEKEMGLQSLNLQAGAGPPVLAAAAAAAANAAAAMLSSCRLRHKLSWHA